MKYFFVPGRKWRLAQAELRSVLSMFDLKFVELSSSDSVLLYDVIAPESLILEIFHRLGGSVKVGTVIEDPFSYLSEVVRPRFVETEGKVYFSVSMYDVFSRSNSEFTKRAKLGMEIKKWLKNSGISSRFVSNFSQLETSAVLLKTNHVLENGFEINRFAHPRTTESVWGVTLDVQDYEGFAKRDYSRPRVNKKKGMIPPKLARIMINLAQVPKNGCIWDPFCGSGTILMEALVLGYNVIGTDVDPLAIEETQENLHWVCEEYWVSHTKFTVFQHDIHDHLPPEIEFDAVVTEPYLGPVIQRKVSVEQIGSLNSSIMPLFDALGREVDRQLLRNRHGNIVAVVPGFRSHTGWLDMNGTFDSHPQIKPVSIPAVGGNEALQWDRPNSIIRRNISQFSY